uniref:ATP synthase complex subunit 8 n=1 Tax=Myiodactylus osmyloides TaxID=560910 RepID=A0A1S5QYR4_9NEOP|nr:ATP synthase F0 subunit 8 [Myiodactylus osmyloides]
MPQMSPLSWFTLTIYFIIVLIIFCILNFYIFLYKPLSKKNNQFSTKSMIWKW